MFPTAVTAVVDNLTVVRTRGSLVLQLNTASAINEGFQWALGICNVTQNAAGIGVTAVPDPFIDMAWDGWFVHEQGFLTATSASV